MHPVIELKNVTKVYDSGPAKFKALNGINLKINHGDFASIMGPSGSGKSTMLHMIGALDTPTNGKIFIDDTDLSKQKESDLARLRGKKIGFVFQFFNLYPNLTAVENVELPMQIVGSYSGEREKRARELLKLSGLDGVENHTPNQLSGGQKQRVAIARALANDPSFILADEPTGNLDSKSGHDIMKLFIKLNKEEDKTIIVVTHDASIAAHSDYTIRIRDGKLVGG